MGNNSLQKYTRLETVDAEQITVSKEISNWNVGPAILEKYPLVRQ